MINFVSKRYSYKGEVLKILTLPKITKRQLSDIEELIKLCNNHEDLEGDVFLSTDFNSDKNIRPFYLLYEGEQLVGFLFLFMPMPQEAEVSAFVHPDFRRRGLFMQLLDKSIKELRGHNVPEILFVRETKGKDALYVLNKLNAIYEFSEYKMIYEGIETSPTPTDLTLEKAGIPQTEMLACLSADIFNEEISASEKLMENSLKASDMTTYIAKKNGEPIGLCSVNHQDREKLMIYGLGIAPSHQGHGYGRQMLALLLEQLQRYDGAQIALEVNSRNAAAYQLYSSNGFSVEMQNDYYRYQI